MEPTADTDQQDRRRPARLLLWATGVVATAAVLALAWRRPGVGAAAARLDPDLGVVLYGVALGALVLSLVLRRRELTRRLADAGRDIVVPAATAAGVLAFCVPLFAAWQGGQWWAMIGGSVPWADAQLYFGGSERLLFFDDLDVYNSRRPLIAMYLAVRLAVTALDLRLALVLQAVIVGGACILAARAVARDLGAAAGAALFAALFGFSRPYVPAAMSEALGVTLGALGFTVVWNAVDDRRRWPAVAGVLLLTIAVDARSGVVLLPVLVALWFGRRHRGTRLLDWRFLGVSGVAIALGLGLNYGAASALGGETNNVLSNGGFLVYGMAKGVPAWDLTEPSWLRIYIDHPEIVTMTDRQRSRFINELVRREILDHPARFTGAAFRSGVNYLQMAKKDLLAPFAVGLHRLMMVAGAAVIALVAMFRARRTTPRRALLDLSLFASLLVALPTVVSRVPSNEPPLWLGAAIVVTGLLGFVVVGTDRLQADRQLRLALAAMVAVVACLPFLGVDTVRVFAAAMPFLALPLALAVGALARAGPPARLRTTAVEDRVARPGGGTGPLVTGGVLVGAILLGTPVAMATVDRPALPDRRCPDGRAAEPLLGGVALRVGPDSTGLQANVDQVSLGEFTRQLSNFAPVPSNHLAGITGPVTLVGGLRADGFDRLAVVDADVRAPGSSPLYLCGDVRHDPLTDQTFTYFPQPLDLFRGRPLPP